MDSGVKKTIALNFALYFVEINILIEEHKLGCIVMEFSNKF